MRVLICGGTGFIGNAIAEHLTQHGHTVIIGVRQPANANQIAVDFNHDVDIEDWLSRLYGIDIVINAVGILVEKGGQTFNAVHRDVPIALFRACERAGVRRVVQVSALGADSGTSPYFQTKRAADEWLMRSQLDWQVIRPALVYGDNGASAGFFRMLASMPVLPVPAGGHQQVQPVHIDDVVKAVERLIDPGTSSRQCVELVGATRLQYRDMLATYRAGLGMQAACTISMPGVVIGTAARLLDYVPGSMLTSDTWKMLQDGNTGEVSGITRLLGHTPRGASQFIEPRRAPALRAQALGTWQSLLLRAVLAIVWIATAIISAFIYPRSESLALLQAVGLTGMPALVALNGAAVFDFGLGIATLAYPGRRLWLLQIATIVAYSLIISVALPEYLVHPFGPVLKNLPILALLLVLISADQRGVV